jgi:nitroimidazol reductase NimA-like FMN-containing flavoprotein (pyridoxamine 5'-phosphate oxidase superfamily)
MPGKKGRMDQANPLVPVLVDTHDEGRERKNVVVYGRFEELLDRINHMPEREHAWSILSSTSTGGNLEP